MTLHLVLTREWFNRVLCGEKRIEYRKNTPFWQKRILDKSDKLDTIVFQYGYTSKKTKVFKIEKIDIGDCPYDGWNDKDYIRIHFVDISQTTLR